MHQEHQWHFLISCRSTKSYLLLQLLLSFAGNRTPQEAHSYGKTSCVELDHSSIKKKPSGDITRPIPYKCFLMKMEFVTVSIFFIMGKSIIFYWSLKKKKVIKYFQYCDPSANHCVLTHDCVTVWMEIGTTLELFILEASLFWCTLQTEELTVRKWLLYCFFVFVFYV